MSFWRRAARAMQVGAALAVGFASDAEATPLLELLGSPEVGESFSAAATARGPMATHFNPALLTLSSTTTSAGLFLLEQRLTVTRAPRPVGFDVPESVYDARLPEVGGGTRRLEFRPLPTARLPEPAPEAERRDGFAHVGTTMAVHERVGIGVQAILPLSGFQAQSPHFADEREQFFSNALHFERYGDRLRSTAIGAGLGVRVLDGLSVGAGATMLNDAVARATVYVPDAADQSNSLTNAAVDVESRLAPHFGLAMHPYGQDRIDALTVGATLHLESSTSVDAHTKIRFWDYDYPEGQDALTQRTRFVYLYEPLRASLAAAGQVTERVSLAGVVRYGRWSTYQDRHAERAGFEDVFEGAVDAALTLEGWRFGAGALYAPTPIPLQTGRTNYVDNDRMGGRVGIARRLATPVGEFSASVDVGLQRLLQRQQEKSAEGASPVWDELPDDAVDVRTGESLGAARGLQTNNPGFPGFESEGWLFWAGLSLTLKLGQASSHPL